MTKTLAKYANLVASGLLLWFCVSLIQKYFTLSKNGAADENFYIYLIIIAVCCLGTGFIVNKIEEKK